MFAILDKDHNVAVALLLKRAIEYKPEENVSLKSNNWVENDIVQRSKTGIMKGLERHNVVQLHRHQNMLLYHLGNGVYEPSHVINMDETSMQQVLLTSKTLGKTVQRNVTGTGDCRRGVHHTNVRAVAMDGTKLALLFIFKSKEGDEIPQTQVSICLLTFHATGLHYDLIDWSLPSPQDKSAEIKQRDDVSPSSKSAPTHRTESIR